MALTEEFKKYHCPSGKYNLVSPVHLTKDNVFKMTEVVPIEITHPGDLFSIANQGVVEHRSYEPDKYGRVFIDKQFCRLCCLVHVEEVDMFQSLSCKKNGDKYIVRLELTNETLEMELTEMVALLEQRMR